MNEYLIYNQSKPEKSFFINATPETVMEEMSKKLGIAKTLSPDNINGAFSDFLKTMQLIIATQMEYIIFAPIDFNSNVKSLLSNEISTHLMN